MSKTLIIGPVFCDLLLEGFSRIPKEGEELFLDSINFSIGGAAITATALARLGVQTQLASVVGDDTMGQFIKDELSSDNIDITSLLTAPELSTGLTLIFPYTKDRGFITRAINEQNFTSKIFPSLEFFDMNEYSNVHLTFSLLKDAGIRQVIAKAKKAGAAVSIDIGYGEAKAWAKGDFNLIEGLDYFILNDKEAKLITGAGDIITSLGLLKRYVKRPVITLGEDGAAFMDESDHFCSIPTLVKNAVNTTGAGDSFTAGLLYGLTKQLPFGESVIRGILTGSLTAASVDSVSPEISVEKIENLAG